MSVAKICLICTGLALGGCASSQAAYNPRDPLEPINRSIYKFNDTVDKAVVKPVAMAYKAVVPEPGRNMVRNFFSNLDDIIVTLNDLLQLKFSQAVSDGSRVVINSTFGIFGLFNVASGLEKHNEDFGQTLGYWGMGSGPYLMLPFFGPSSIRDGAGLYVDSEAGPVEDVEPVQARNQLILTKITSLRADLLDQEKILDEAAVDRYAFIRDAYLQRRLSLVHDGNPPREKIRDEYDEDEEEEDATFSQPAKDSGQAPLPQDSAPVTNTQPVQE